MLMWDATFNTSSSLHNVVTSVDSLFGFSTLSLAVSSHGKETPRVVGVAGEPTEDHTSILTIFVEVKLSEDVPDAMELVVISNSKSDVSLFNTLERRSSRVDVHGHEQLSDVIGDLIEVDADAFIITMAFAVCVVASVVNSRSFLFIVEDGILNLSVLVKADNAGV